MQNRIVLLLTGLLCTSVALAAGMDSSTGRLKGSDYKSTDNTSRFTSPGSLQMDNGMIVKWGTTTVPALTTSRVVTFATPFPNSLLDVDVTVEAGALSGTSASVSATSKTSFTVNIQCLSLTGPIACTSSTNVRWSASGY